MHAGNVLSLVLVPINWDSEAFVSSSKKYILEEYRQKKPLKGQSPPASMASRKDASFLNGGLDCL